MINQIGKTSLAYAPLQFANLWQFNIIDTNPIGYTASTIDSLSGMSEIAIPAFLVRNIKLPFTKLEIESKSSGRKVYSAVNHVEPFSITFLELELFPALKFLTTWFEKVYDPRNNVFKTGLTNSPTKSGILTIYSALIPDLPTQVYIYEGLRISGIQDIELTYDNNDPLQITADFVCDKVYTLTDWADTKYSDTIAETKSKIDNFFN